MDVEVQDSKGNVRNFMGCYPTFSTRHEGLLFIDNGRGMQAWYPADGWLDIIVRNERAPVVDLDTAGPDGP